MSANSFFENPILNSPYEYPRRHWKMDADNKPTGEIAEARRPSSNRTPIATPRAKGQGEKALQQDLFLDSSKGVDYRENELINYIRAEVDNWRASPEENWHVTAETAWLLKHWRSFEFPSYRPFFCQVEAAETLIWLVEVKGYRYVDANIKKATMETLWIPGVNAEKTYGRWAFIELNQNDFTLDGLTSDEALLENCREAYAAKIDELRVVSCQL